MSSSGAGATGRRRTLVVVALALLLAVAGLVGFLALGGRGGAGVRATIDAGAGSSARSRRARGTGTERGPARDDDERLGPLPFVPPRIVVARDPSALHGSFEGRVVSSETGLGVAGAELTFTHEELASSARTDAEGRFAFLPEEEGPHAIALVTADGYLPFAPAIGQSPLSFVVRAGERLRDVVLYLHPARELVAVVTDAGGQPVEGAEVRLVGLERGDTALAALADRFVTDAHGEARFQAPDGTRVEARKDGFRPARARVGRDDEDGRIELQLAPGEGDPVGTERLSGRVLGPHGEGVEGATVRASVPWGGPRGQRGPNHFGGSAGATATTDAEGRFELEGLLPGTAILFATHADYLQARGEAEVPTSQPVELRLEVGAVLEGTVSARGGGPVAAFSVTVLSARGSFQRWPVARRTFLDSAGRFELRGLRPGTFSVVVAANGYATSEPQEVTLADTPGARASARFVLSSGGRVTGRVLAEGAGTPVGGARVTPESGMRDDDTRVPVAAIAITDADGTFELTGLSPGLRSLRAEAPGYHTLLRSGVQVQDGQTTGPIEIQLAPRQEGEEQRQELVGIGVILGADGDRIVVRRVLDGGGGAEAGLVAGDAILRVDGVAVTELGFEQTMERIRGAEGTRVTLGLRRAGGQESDVVVRRRRVRI